MTTGQQLMINRKHTSYLADGDGNLSGGGERGGLRFGHCNFRLNSLAKEQAIWIKG